MWTDEREKKLAETIRSAGDATREAAEKVAWQLLARQDRRHDVLDRKASAAAGASAILVAILGTLAKSEALSPCLDLALLVAAGSAVASTICAVWALGIRGDSSDLNDDFVFCQLLGHCDDEAYVAGVASHVARVASEKEEMNGVRAGWCLRAQACFVSCVVVLGMAVLIRVMS